MRKDLIIAVLLTFCLTATLFTIATTQSQEYDPWTDLNEDGKIDILDVVGMTSIYGTTGDSTKSVNVANWPVTKQQTVFWAQTTDAWSNDYNASGFGHMHLTWKVPGLVDPEKVILRIYSYIRNPSNEYEEEDLEAQSLEITYANYKGALTLPVPSETFLFYIDLPAARPAYVAFYLTYA